MRRVTSILVVALVAAACGGDGTADTTAAPTTTVAPQTTVVASSTAEPSTTMTPTTGGGSEAPDPAPSPPLVITAVDFDEEYAVITNVSGADYSLEGHFVCNFPSYAPIGALGTVAAGDSFTIELATFAASVGSGELAIYTSNEFADPDAMVVYVEWGTPDHGRSGVAVAAGLWTAGDFVDNGKASFRALTNGGSGDDYVLVE